MEEGSAIAIIAHEVAELVEIAALGSAHRCRPGRIQLMRQIDQRLGQRLGLGKDALVCKEYLIAHAPGDDGRMIAMRADHLGELLAAALLEFWLILRVDRVGAGRPETLSCLTTRAPERQFRPEQHPLPVTLFGKDRVMGIV